MRMYYNGRHTVVEGRRPGAASPKPKKRVKWIGLITLSDQTGAAIELPWETFANQPLNYAEAKCAIFAALDLAKDKFIEAYSAHASQVTFRMESR